MLALLPKELLNIGMKVFVHAFYLLILTNQDNFVEFLLISVKRQNKSSQVGKDSF